MLLPHISAGAISYFAGTKNKKGRLFKLEKITISMDSGFDVPEELIQKYHIKTVPVTLNMGNRIFDDNEITPEEMTEWFYQNKKKIITTSPPSSNEYYKFFTGRMHMGNTVIHLSLSSQMSECYENAVMGANTFNKVHVVDTRTVTIGAVPFILKIAQMQEQGKTAVEIVDNLHNEFYKKVHLSFLPNTLDFLHSGGKIRPVGKFLTLFLGIKPSIVLNPDEYFTADKKFKGEYETAVKEYIRYTFGNAKNVDRNLMWIGQTTGFRKDLLEQCKNETEKSGDFKNISLIKTGCVITSHFGDNCIILCWKEKD